MGKSGDSFSGCTRSIFDNPAAFQEKIRISCILNLNQPARGDWIYRKFNCKFQIGCLKITLILSELKIILQ